MNKQLRYLIVLLIGIIPFNLIAQFSFQKVFGGGGDDWGVKAIELKNGNFLFVGTTTSYDESNYAACYNKTGKLLWIKHFQYHGYGAEDNINDLIEASDGYIYIGGDGFVWNSEGNPIYTKMDLNGNIIYDSAYSLPLIGFTNATIREIFDDSINHLLISLGPGFDNINHYPVFQKTLYNGERLYYKYIKELANMGAIKTYRTFGKDGFSIVCKADSQRIYLVDIDTAGNVLGKKYLFDRWLYMNSYSKSEKGNFAFVTFDNGSGHDNGIISKYNSKGDSLLTKKLPGDGMGGILLSKDLDEFILLGSKIYVFDTLMNLKDSLPLFKIIDSVGLITAQVARDGGFYGVSGYFGGIRNWQFDPKDFYFYKTYPNGTLSQQVEFLRTGIVETKALHKEALVFYPNPCNESVLINNLDKGDVIEIYSILGEKVIATIELRINTSNINNGSYFIQIKDKMGVIKERQSLMIIH